MLIGIIHINNVNVSPYLLNYIDILREERVDYELIMWDRQNTRDAPAAGELCFSSYAPTNMPRILKIKHLLAFRRFALTTIRERKYDRLIVLTTLTAQLLRGLLTSRYKDNYYFDIRDFTYEQYAPYQSRERGIIEASAATAISSQGFLSFLPPSKKYVLAHNIQNTDLKNARGFVPEIRRNGERINLVFNGLMKYRQMDYRLMEHLGNDDRFLLFYNGSEQTPGSYTSFCKSRAIENVYFSGEFTTERKPMLLKDAHILHNYFEGLNPRYAMSNRYYDALIYGIPQLSNPQTYCGQKVAQKMLGVAIPMDDANFADRFYGAFNDFDHDAFQTNRTNELSSVLEQQAAYLDSIRSFVRGDEI